jgi:hypothetical protein
MKKTKIIDLVKGTFTPSEAREIIFQLLDSKINFHNLKNLSSRERFGRPDVDSEQRLEQLKESRKEAEALILSSTAEKKSVTIKSAIELTVE